MKYLKKIKVEAKKRNIPLKQLANSIDVTVEVLKNALKNDTLSVHHLNTICVQLSIDVGDIFVLENSVEMKNHNKLHFLSNKIFY